MSKHYRAFFRIKFSFVLLISCLYFSVHATLCKAGESENQRSRDKYQWTGTWATAPQLVEPNNMPPAPGLTNNTLRQVVCVSIGGDSIRVRFSNDFSKSAVTMKQVQLAVALDGPSIDPNTIKELKFKGQSVVTMAPGGSVVSDPLAFHLDPRMKVAVTINFGETSPTVTGHPGSRTTSYLMEGSHSSTDDFSKAIPTDHWYVINGIDIKASKKSGAIAIIGNSITDGRGSGTNKQNRWPDVLAERLLRNKSTAQISVLNLGIGGNCVVRGGLGPTALNRFDRDILSQSNVKWLIILEGVNDIGGARNDEVADKIAGELIKAYEEMIGKAHAKGIKVYGATILPFAKSQYGADYKLKAQQTVNNWIRNSGRFDKVIDFDKLMCDPSNTTMLLPDMHTGDFLHPNEVGYQRMGNSIHLKLFK